MEAILKWCIVSFNYSYTTAAKHKIASMTMNLPGNPTSCEVASHAIRWHLWHYEQNQKKSILDHNILWLLQWYLKPNSKARQRFQLTHLWCRYIEMYLCNINWATYQHGRSWCVPRLFHDPYWRTWFDVAIITFQTMHPKDMSPMSHAWRRRS